MSHPLCQARCMKNIKPITRRSREVKNGKNDSININDFDQLTAAGENIEHVTVPGFLRRIPHPWHIDDITRYGDKVGRVAEAMQLSYLTTIQPKLGMIRVFPVSLLQRVYQLMAPQFGWPRLLDETAMLEDGRAAQREALRVRERVAADLAQIGEVTDNVQVLDAAQTVREFIDADIARLKGELVPA